MEKSGSRDGWADLSLGGEADPNQANYEDTNLGTTSAVGCFPGGASPYGCLDMSGNTWEWLRTKYEHPDDHDLEGDAPRVLRGGVYYGNEYLVRCAVRNGLNPYNRYYRYRLSRGGVPIITLVSEPSGL
jgi:formylglycine-generating enzyme required for sulfatase activity